MCERAGLVVRPFSFICKVDRWEFLAARSRAQSYTRSDSTPHLSPLRCEGECLCCTSHQRVPLLGIAQRHICTQYAHILRKSKLCKPLTESIKTFGNLIRAKREQKGIAPYQLAAKMGIASARVNSWESGESEPDEFQKQILGSLLGLDA